MFQRNLAISAHGLFFCLIPKVANSSIRVSVLRSLGLPEPECHNRNHEALCLSNCGAKPGGSFAAAVIRHPASRVVSVWADKIRQWKEGGSKGLQDDGFKIGANFDEFVRALPYHSHKNHHTASQTEFLASRMDLLWRYENIEAGWRKLQGHVSWLLGLCHINSGEHDEWAHYYDAETLAIVERVYAADVDLWRSI